VLAIDGANADADADALKLLQRLAHHDIRPATVLVGKQDERVLAGVHRIATARRLPVVAVRQRPLKDGDLEQLLLEHMIAPLPITRVELEQALAEQEFLLQYQPKISLGAEGMRVIGVEALVRWRHPSRGMLLPRHFLESVEQHGMLTPLTDFVITEAVRQTGLWNGAGIELQIAINLSPRLVKDRAFPARLATLLREQNLSTAQVMLDVTETGDDQDRELLQDVFTRLRVMGVGLSLDNFGAVQSSLSELYRTPYSEIKIDRRLLEDATRDHDADLVVRALVNLAHQLRITVCAAGVETAQVLEFIRSADFDAAQGRLFSDPVAPGRIEELLAELAQSRTAGTGVWRALRVRTTRNRRGPASAGLPSTVVAKAS
jgi:EAL domain-containing protein (putative c-di-GMP-specific phosphodiesterase class I)